jgi:hypothetical protein
MSRSEGEWKNLVVAGVITLGNVALIWSFRFLPLYDYPIWLFETKILREFFNPQFSYSTYYQVVATPVPNLMFTAFTWLLSWIVSLETAGKLFLTLCTVGFPWAFWYSMRRLSPNANPILAYLGFPYSFNLFMFGGHDYLLGLILLSCIVGYFIPRFSHLCLREWLLLSTALLVLYFTHAIPFAVAVLVFVGFSLSLERQRWRRLIAVSGAVLPSILAFGWYLTASPKLSEISGWSLLTVGRNALKPIFLFTKSYGIETFLPITFLNGLWLVLLLATVTQLVKVAWRNKLWDKGFLLPIIVSGLMVLLLPDNFLGVYQPGTRFTLPLVFLVLWSTVQVHLAQRLRLVLFAAAIAITLYNIYHFRGVDKQAHAFYDDLMAEVDLREPSYVIRFDWPAGTSILDKVSASVNPLSVVPYYVYTERGGVSWIHETGILKLKREYRQYAPALEGETIQQFYSSVVSVIDHLTFFKSIIVLGKGKEADSIVQKLEQLGFRSLRRRELWTILGAAG